MLHIRDYGCPPSRTARKNCRGIIPSPLMRRSDADEVESYALRRDKSRQHISPQGTTLNFFVQRFTKLLPPLVNFKVMTILTSAGFVIEIALFRIRQSKEE